MPQFYPDWGSQTSILACDCARRTTLPHNTFAVFHVRGTLFGQLIILRGFQQSASDSPATRFLPEFRLPQYKGCSILESRSALPDARRPVSYQVSRVGARM
jgi:hypothetical protein